MKQPTAIVGTARERLTATAADLRALSPQAAKTVIDRALALLSSFVAEKASEQKAILWGHDIQTGYADAVAKTLTLSQSPVMLKVQGYIARTLEILGAFDLAGSAGNAGRLAGFLKGFNRRTDTLDELAIACGELDRLTGLMGGALEELLKLRDELEKNVRTHEAIALEAEAAALAALYLSEHVRTSRPSVADRFVERSMSLTQTLAQLKGNSAIRNIQLEHPMRLIGALQNVTLVSMPDFLASLAAINSLALRNVSLTPTEASELNYKLRDIIHQLKI